VKRKGIDQKTLAGWKVGMLKRKRLKVQIQKLRAKKRRGEGGMGYFRGDGIEHSRLTIT